MGKLPGIALGQRFQIVAEALDGACALDIFAW